MPSNQINDASAVHNALAQSSKLRLEQSRLNAKLKLAQDEVLASEKRAEVSVSISACCQIGSTNNFKRRQAAEAARETQMQQSEEHNKNTVEAMQAAVAAAEVTPICLSR